MLTYSRYNTDNNQLAGVVVVVMYVPPVVDRNTPEIWIGLICKPNNELKWWMHPPCGVSTKSTVRGLKLLTDNTQFATFSPCEKNYLKRRYVEHISTLEVEADFHSKESKLKLNEIKR